jgi:opacity protein-like surface antigen
MNTASLRRVRTEYEPYPMEAGMKKVILLISVAILVVALAAPATAQPDKRFLITAGAGYSKLFDLTITALNGEERDNHNPTPGGFIGFGAGVFYEAVPNLSVGGEVSLLNFGTQKIGHSDDSYYAVPVTGQAFYMIPTGSAATPFLTGGAGLYYLRNKVSVIDDAATKNVFGFNVGGGLKTETDMTLEFGVDVRFHMAVNPELPFDGISGTKVYETTNWKMLTVMGRAFF